MDLTHLASQWCSFSGSRGSLSAVERALGASRLESRVSVHPIVLGQPKFSKGTVKIVIDIQPKKKNQDQNP